MPARRRGLPLRLIRCVALLAALGLVLLMGPGAAAHALVASSDPADGATLASSPSQVVITFTEQPDVKRSLIEVLDTSGHKAEDAAERALAGEDNLELIGCRRVEIPVADTNRVRIPCVVAQGVTAEGARVDLA